MRKYYKIPWPIFFLLLGVISILGQSVILREITTLFYGNELFYGLGLGIWCLFTGLGSLLAKRLKFLKNTPLIWFILIGLCFFLPFLISLLRLMVAGYVPIGQLPGFGLSIFTLTALLLVFCFPLGAVFPLATIFFRSQEKKNLVNKAYFWETIGFVFAGLIFSFILSTTSFPFTPKINQLTLKWRYPDLTKTLNSKYNQIIITQKDKQFNFFLNGQLSFTNQERLENKQLLSLISPFTKETKKILVLASPILTDEIKNIFPDSAIDFLEIDNKLLKLEKDFLVKDVNLVVADPRKFLTQTDKLWDLIIFSPGNPQTLLGNRYFSQESFALVKNHLSGDGVFVLLFYLPTDYQSQEAIRFGRSIYQTLKSVFPKIEILVTEDQIILLGSFKELKIDKTKINPLYHDYFWYQAESVKRDEIFKKLTDKQELINTDFEPVVFFYQQLFWQTMFSFKIPRIIQILAVVFPLILLIITLFFLLMGQRETKLGTVVASSSFILISIETLIIFMFQTKIGYLYSQISLIFASVLLGMAIGVKIVEKLSIHRQSLSVLKLSFICYLLILVLLLGVQRISIVEWPIFWLILGLATGVIGGTIFALVNNLYFRKAKNPGFIYAFDLFGGFFGALLTSSFLIPTIGVKGLILGFIVLIAINFISIAKLPE